MDRAGTFEGQHLQQDPTGLNLFNVLSVIRAPTTLRRRRGGKEGLRQVVTTDLDQQPGHGGVGAGSARGALRTARSGDAER